MGCHKEVLILNLHLEFILCFPTWLIKCQLPNALITISCWCSSLGRPRRFSQQFLKEEREKLNQYRESVRGHYAELRAGTREGLPTDLARPLSVGQRVIALHPRTREIHNGSVLTVDHCRCRIQFDQPELGVEFVLVLFLPSHYNFLLGFMYCVM